MGMKRTTRVFGVAKAGDGARVLRSGRRIWPNVEEPKLKRAHDVVDRDFKGNNKVSARSNVSGSKSCSPRGVSSEKEDFRVTKRRKVSSEEDDKTVDKMCGIVYTRKKKKEKEKEKQRVSNQSSDRSEEPLKFYSRRRRRRRRVYAPVITVIADGSCEDCWIYTVFGLVMRYVRKEATETLRLSSLASFFLSQPISDAFADHGVRFLTEPPFSSNGVCKFFGAMDGLLLVSAHFSAIPRCFMDMHFTLFLRAAPRSFAFVKRSLYLLNNPVEECDSESELAVAEPCDPSVRATKLTGGNVQYRGNLGFHSIQKRRSSLRRRRGRKPLPSVHKFYNGTSVSELLGSWKARTAAAVSSRKLRSSVVTNPSPIPNGISTTLKPKTKEELDSLSCSANVLTIESDRCTREEGFGVMLEFSSSKEWFVVVKKDGVIRYSFKARKTMRPCSSNRFTHSTVWIGDSNWKLEFCDKQDWLDFKEIYKECHDRDVLEQNSKVIPIPGVREVENVDDFPSFSMPVPYISVKEDEVSRVMARSTAIYDMDSEDEEWLGKQSEEMPRDSFELMIDGFEKGCFHRLGDDNLDEKAASVASLLYLGRQEVVEAVHGYWTRKRKKRKAPLLRVFQLHQEKKTPLLSKPVFRKRRSFRRQGSQLHGKGKSKHLTLVAEQRALEEENLFLRAEEAKAMANTAMEIAEARRRRAQMLAENADLAVYKAMMALRIAEAAEPNEQVDTTTNLFLD